MTKKTIEKRIEELPSTMTKAKYKRILHALTMSVIHFNLDDREAANEELQFIKQMCDSVIVD